MKRVLFLLLAAACTPAQDRRPVDPEALRGFTVGLPMPADARRTHGIGCGEVSDGLALRAHRLMIAEFTDAGANPSLSDHAPWVVLIALREAAMGLSNTEGPRRTDKPIESMPPDAPSIDEPRPSLFNGNSGHAEVVLDATLLHQGAVIWRESVTGRADSAACLEAIDKIHEALRDGIEQIRDRVIPRIRGL